MSAADTSDTARRNRLQWQCRRGMRELDELLKSFLVKRYNALATEEQRVFEQLLAYPDSVLLELLMGRMTAADRDVAALVADIRYAAQA